MSTPSPLQPQGALVGASTPRSRVRVTVLTILALHVVFIGGLLLQGCDKAGTPTGAASNAVSTLPPLADTNYYTSFPGDTQPAIEPATTPIPSNPPARTVPPDPGVRAPAETTLGGLGTPAPGSFVTTGTTTEHVIQQGDTLGDLAKKYGVSVQAIIDANPNAKPRSLKIDDKIVIPPPTAATSPQTASATGGTEVDGEVYIVKAGDNLSRIAKKFGVSVSQLRAANNITGDRILPKQRLVIPPKNPPASGVTNLPGQSF